ncbi:hypothetical protein [Lysinibacillus sp. FJAT-14222]|uniref:hypothetical protein n=1 Tax=Lysinibacillus sp. FJAT-14222 TaxID=1932366 RepID=UPI00116086EE|nr:hypothetical protein [Lysinibacillus sp. FJAT-14222]
METERLLAAHRTPPGSSALRESEASAANALSVRKRSDSSFICAKAKRQQQCFICAKAKRQQQQSAQSERKSTPRFAEELYFI